MRQFIFPAADIRNKFPERAVGNWRMTAMAEERSSEATSATVSSWPCLGHRAGANVSL